jgi:O-antigen/teichoic acid export membrane protein
MNKYLRAISDNFIFFVFNVIFFLAITPVAMRIMGEEFYGLWVVLSALMLFSNVGNLGIGALVMKFSSETSPHGAGLSSSNRSRLQGYFIVFVMSIIISVLMLLARGMISNNIHVNAELRMQFQQAMVWVPSVSFLNFWPAYPMVFCSPNCAIRQSGELNYSHPSRSGWAQFCLHQSRKILP